MKLDKKDLDILHVLDGDGRISYSQLGKKVRLTKETTRNRVANLYAKKVLSFVYPIFKIEGVMYNVYLTVNQTSAKKEREIESFIRAQKNCVFVYVCEGSYNFKLLVHVKTNKELISFFEDLRKEFKHLIKEKEIHAVDIYQKFSFNSSKSIATISSEPLSEAYSPKQSLILKDINTDGRKTAVSIANSTDLTTRIVVNQLKLLKDNLLAYAVCIDAQQIGKLRCFFDISLHDLSVKSQIIYFFARQNILRTAIVQLGKYDLSLEIFVDSVEQLRELLATFKEKFYKHFVFFDTAMVLNHQCNGWNIE